MPTATSPAVPATAMELPDTMLRLLDVGCVLCGGDATRPEAGGYDFEYRTAANTFSFVRCATCGHFYLDPRPSAEDLAVIYPPTYYSLTGPSNPIVRRLQRVWERGKARLYQQLIGVGPRRILDVGCGNGRFLSILRRFGDPEWELVGLDFDEKAVEQCATAGFEAHAGRVEDFAEGRECFDGVIMLQLIEHVDDPRSVAAGVHDLLKPGGCFIVETPNLAGLDYRIFRGRWWGHYHFPRHWHLFTTDSMRHMLESCGFVVERCDYLISTSAWTISLHNYFIDRGYPWWFVRFFSYQNPLLLGIFVAHDWLRARLGMQTSNQRVVARKPVRP